MRLPMFSNLLFFAGCASIVCCAGEARAGRVVVMERSSSALFDIFAGAGGAVDRVRVVGEELTDPLGPYAFSEFGNVIVLPGQPFSTGGAQSNATHSMTDLVTQLDAQTVEIRATRDTAGTTAYISGGGLGFCDLAQRTLVNVFVLGSDATVTIEGSIDPGDLGNDTLFDVGVLEITRPFTSLVPFRQTAPGAISWTGTLQANAIYSVNAHFVHSLNSGATNVVEADGSAMEVVVTITSNGDPCVADTTTTNTNPNQTGFGLPDGEVNGADLSYFVEQWLAGARVADVTTDNTNPGDAGFGTPDGIVNGADLSFYIEAWLAGCP